MRWTRLLLACVAVAGCAQAGAGLTRDGVAFGPSMTMQGFASSGFEHDAIVLCGGARASCIASRDRRDNGCWVERTVQASADQRALAGNDVFDKYGYASHWIEFTGRKTVSDGQYGHLGGYKCKILMERVRVFEHLRPSQPN